MKFLLSFLFFLSAQYTFAQESRHASHPPVDSATLAVQNFETQLSRLREAVSKNDVSSMTASYAHLRGDMRSAIEYVETKSPESQRLTSMRDAFKKFEGFAFDPAKPAELKPYLAYFDEFLKSLKEALGEK